MYLAGFGLAPSLNGTQATSGKWSESKLARRELKTVVEEFLQRLGVRQKTISAKSCGSQL